MLKKVSFYLAIILAVIIFLTSLAFIASIFFPFEILKPKGELIYSTCTHAPEENEAVVDFVLKELGDKIKLEKISLPIKTREGITNFENQAYSKEVKKCARIYPQDNNTEGFFIAKFRKLK